MRKTVRLTESDFINIVKEAVIRFLNEDFRDEEKPARIERERNQIPHTSKAFAVGDEILYWRSDSDGGMKKHRGIVKSFDGSNIVVDENGKERTYSTNPKSTGRSIVGNRTWLRPFKHFMEKVFPNATTLPTFNEAILDYEKDESGNDMITVTDKFKQKKYWYTRNGEFVKTTSTNRQYVSKWKGIPNSPKAGKIDSTRVNSNFVDLEDDWFVVDKGGKFLAWRIEKADEIVEACPWLKNMMAPWKKDGEKANMNYNPFG